MKKLIWLLLGVLILVACGGSEPAASGETAVSPTTAAANPAAPAAAQTMTLAEASIVRERDWVKGATVPVVTIIEYGDFQ